MRKVVNVKRNKRTPIVKVTELGIPEKYSLRSVGITQSLLMEYKKCKRKFLYKLNRWSSLKEYYTTSFGSLFHHLLDKRYSGKKTITSKLINDYEKKNRNDLVGINQQDWENEKAIAEIILKIYQKVYKKDFTTKKFIDVEREIYFPFPTAAGIFIMRMKIDGRFVDKGENFNLENKTASRINEVNLMKRLSYDFQNLFYLYGSNFHYKENTYKILYNIIRKPQIRKRQKETLKDFMSRLKKDVLDRPNFYFMRYEIPYKEDDLFQFRMELQHTLENLQMDIDSAIEYKAADEVFYKCESCCEFPFPCKYIDACSSGTMAGYKQRSKLFPELEKAGF
jgi:hypothetical protein